MYVIKEVTIHRIGGEDYMKKITILILYIIPILLGTQIGIVGGYLSGNYSGIEVIDPFIPDTLPPSQQITGNITIYSNEEWAKVGPGDDGLVQFHGNVTVNTMAPTIQLIVVDLRITVKELDCTIIPSTMTFSASGTDEPKDFTIVVEVPNFTSSTKEFKLTVSGTARPIPGAQTYPLDPAEGTIRVEQYFGSILKLRQVNHTLYNGESKKTTVTLYNWGNGPDEVRLAIPAKNTLSELGIIFEKDTDWIPVTEGGSLDLEISVSVNENGTEGENLIEIWAVSKKAFEENNEEYVGRGYINIIIMEEDSFFSTGNWVMYALGGFLIIVLGTLIGYLARRKKKSKE